MENELKDFLEDAVTMGKTRLKHAIIEKLNEYYQAGYKQGVADTEVKQ